MEHRAPRLPENPFEDYRLCTQVFHRSDILRLSLLLGKMLEKESEEELERRLQVVMSCVEELTALKRALLADNSFPCKYIEPPDMTLDSGMEWLSYCTEIIPFLAAVTLMAMRPYLEQPSFPVVISGDCDIDPRTLGDSLGVPLATLTKKEEIKPLRKYNAEHRWPIMVPYDYDTDPVKLRSLKMEDFRHTLFYMADSKLARLFASTQANIIHVPLKGPDSSTLIDWASLLPTIKRLFFERLQNFLHNKPDTVSDKTFLSRERSYWVAEFNRSKAKAVLSTD